MSKYIRIFYAYLLMLYTVVILWMQQPFNRMLIAILILHELMFWYGMIDLETSWIITVIIIFGNRIVYLLDKK